MNSERRIVVHMIAFDATQDESGAPKQAGNDAGDVAKKGHGRCHFCRNAYVAKEADQ